MFTLTDDAICAAVDSISGYIVSVVALQTGKTIEEVSEAFYASEAFELLDDKETGYYWDSISGLIEKFKAEIALADEACLQQAEMVAFEGAGF